MSLMALFARLTPINHRITSPANPDYNCIAWSAGDTERWWQPGQFWPTPAQEGEFGIAILEHAMESRGYEDCHMDAGLEPGFEKVALYGNNFLYTHVARQLVSGKWTSKIGFLEDIEHESPEDLTGAEYGQVVEIMKRANP